MARRLEFHNQRAQLRVSESSRFYHTLLRNFYKFLVPPNRSVVELGSGTGDLLAAVQPELGVGIDFSPAMVEIASKRHPELTFIESDVDSFSGGQSFDYLLMSDLVNDLPDVQRTLTRALKFAHKDSRIVLNFFNNLWRPILTLAIWLGLKAPTLLPNWLSKSDMENLLDLAGWEVVKTDERILIPIKIPFIASFINRWVAPLPLIRHLSLAWVLPRQTQPDSSDVLIAGSHHCL